MIWLLMLSEFWFIGSEWFVCQDDPVIISQYSTLFHFRSLRLFAQFYNMPNVFCYDFLYQFPVSKSLVTMSVWSFNLIMARLWQLRMRMIRVFVFVLSPLVCVVCMDMEVWGWHCKTHVFIQIFSWHWTLSATLKIEGFIPTLHSTAVYFSQQLKFLQNSF